MKQIAEILGLSQDRVKFIIDEHKKDIKRIDEMFNIYKGKMKIENRSTRGFEKPNFKYAGNHAKYISTIINAYFIGNAPRYTFDEATLNTDSDHEEIEVTDGSDQASKVAPAMTLGDQTILTIADWYKKRHVAEHDFKMGKNLSIAGRAPELIYADPSSEDLVIKIKALDPRQTILFRDTDIEESVKGALYFFEVGKEKIKVYLYTDTQTYIYNSSSIDSEYTLEDVSEHHFGGVPIIEYYNNEEKQGDFEQVVSIIDAYNQIMSDRINDKEQLVNAILVVTGGTLPEGWSDKLKKDRMLAIPKDGSKVEWLTRSMTESDVEVLRKSIKDDIHQFSFVPNLTDENFAGNASGVAMSYKLIGMELLIKEKETNFSKGLRLRLKRLFNVWALAGLPEFDYESIEIEYIHSLPVSSESIYDIIPVVRDLVSDETLLSQIDFIKNPHDEMKKVQDQKKKAIEANQKAFSMGAYPFGGQATATEENNLTDDAEE